MYRLYTDIETRDEQRMSLSDVFIY